MSTIRGLKTLIIGAPGAGKTHATATLAGVPQFKRVIHLCLDPSSLPVLKKAWLALFGTIPEHVSWHEFENEGSSLDELEKIAAAMGANEGDAFTAWKPPADIKARHQGLTALTKRLKNLPDDRTGELLGPANEWGTDTCFVLDGVNVLCDIIWGQAYGGRIDIEPKEYSRAQGFLETVVKTINYSWPCHFVAVCHVEERAKDKQAAQQSAKNIEYKLFPKLLGGALRDVFTGWFNETVLAKRLGTSYVWDTQSANADVKHRILPMRMDNPADFRAYYKLVDQLELKSAPLQVVK
jgi:hypothetical protein